jgi:hypothetical protein
MDMAQQEKTALVVVLHMDSVSSYDGKPYGRFAASVYAARPDAHYEESPWSYLWGHESDYADFAMEASYGHAGILDGGVYGFTYGYRPSGSLLHHTQIARYAKGMKRVERAYERRVETCGRPESLGQEVVYVLQALGIRRAFVRVPADVIARCGGGSSYREWRPLDSMEGIQAYLNTQVREFKDAHVSARSAA